MNSRLTLRACAFAKINLTLRVLGRRPDGYHELRTVFQSIALHDRLTFEVTPGAFAINCADPSCPTDRSNLVWKAAMLIWRAARRRGPVSGVRVTLEKRIPMQAGLGGGSSDAAATLRVLRRLWCPTLSDERILKVAAALGADVAFFLTGGTALGVERGNLLFPLADAPRSWVVLAQPDFGVSTADAYRWFDAEATTPGARVDRAAGPYGDGGNDLQPPVAARHPAISKLIRALKRDGAHWAAMSGSGSACFGVFDSVRAAQRAASALSGPRCATWLTRTQTARQFSRGSEPVRLGRAGSAPR